MKSWNGVSVFCTNFCNIFFRVEAEWKHFSVCVCVMSASPWRRSLLILQQRVSAAGSSRTSNSPPLIFLQHLKSPLPLARFYQLMMLFLPLQPFVAQRNRRPYVGRRSFFVLGHAALQIEGEVVAVHQDSFAKLLLKLLHVRFNPWEIEFLQHKTRKSKLINLRLGEVWECPVWSYLCVRVQGEQLQSGLTPHPGLDVSGALWRRHLSS